MRALLASLLLSATILAQGTTEEQVAWLQANASPALDGLAAMIGKARVVCLGEASHGDGTTFEQKVAICRHLYEKQGFSVIVFESGFYECHRAWQEILAGKPAQEAAQRAIFPVWTRSAQVRPLWDLIGAQSRGKKPLELAGFDFQPSGVHTKASLLADVESAVKQVAPKLLESSAWRDVRSVYGMLRDGAAALRSVAGPEQARFLAGSQRVAAALEDSRAFLAQVVRSQATFLRFLWNLDFRKPDPAVFNLREEQGAENLLWLLKHRYAGRRVLVWGATSHLSRNRQKIETEIAPRMVPVGHHLAKALGKDLFTLAFVAHHGEARIARKGARSSAIQAAPAGSFADLFARTKHDRAFVDLRRVPWLQEPRTARPMGHTPMRARWNEVVDAFCFIRAMHPSTLAARRR